MRRTFSVLVQNQPGVLARVAGLFGRRGFNIESLAVSITQDPELSRMTIVVDGDEPLLEQVKKQLNKLINVIKVTELEAGGAIARELALVRVNALPSQRAAIMQVVDIFRAKIVDVARRSLVIEITGNEDKVSALVDLLREFGIMEVVRTGKIAMARGSKETAESKGGMNRGQGVVRSGRRLAVVGRYAGSGAGVR
ncbi:MAG TPA: acetolactate synthase small subunit [Firmicutes bacterium]|nr:acetolactate synthase small subunit [Bacillota bacterium]